MRCQSPCPRLASWLSFCHEEHRFSHDSRSRDVVTHAGRDQFVEEPGRAFRSLGATDINACLGSGDTTLCQLFRDVLVVQRRVIADGRAREGAGLGDERAGVRWHALC